MEIDRLEIDDSRYAGEDRETANQENQDPAHDAICAITVLIAMPVANTKVRVKIRKIVFMVRLSSRTATLPGTGGGFCDGCHGSSVWRIGEL
jgi:hypothetical protein